MDIVKKVDKLRLERGWSINRLASEAMITQSTLANMFNSGAEPKISTLKAFRFPNFSTRITARKSIRKRWK